MNQQNYEEVVLGGSYISARHKKASPSTLSTTIGALEDDVSNFAYPSLLRGSYNNRPENWPTNKIAEIQKPIIAEPSFTDIDNTSQHHKQSSAKRDIVPSPQRSPPPPVVRPKPDHFRSSPTRDKSSQPSSSPPNSQFRPPATIKDYKDSPERTPTPHQGPIDPYYGSLNDNVMVDFDESSDPTTTLDKERSRVEDAIERYAQARVYASFEQFLQEKKPCYVENCGFRNLLSPDVVSNRQEETAFRDCQVDEGGPAPPAAADGLSLSAMMDDVSEEQYDRLTATPADDFLHENNLSNSVINCSGGGISCSNVANHLDASLDSSSSDAISSMMLHLDTSADSHATYNRQIGCAAAGGSRTFTDLTARFPVSVSMESADSALHYQHAGYATHVPRVPKDIHDEEDDEEDDDYDDDDDDEDDYEDDENEEENKGYPEMKEC